MSPRALAILNIKPSLVRHEAHIVFDCSHTVDVSVFVGFVWSI